MKPQLNELLQHLNELSDERRNHAIGLQDVSESLSEWHHGYSEGLEHAIEKIEFLLKEGELHE